MSTDNDDDLFYGFYSKKQKKVLLRNKNYKTNLNYKLYNTNEIVEVTTVFQKKMFESQEDCDIMFDDVKYLGIVTYK